MFLYKLYEPPHRGNHVCVAQQTRTFFGTFLLPLLVVTHSVTIPYTLATFAVSSEI